ncbi:FecR family protein [Dyadobacter pollutisoli]|uniref:FecR domain-containing protein n=1 Tax=Dyadobacter pollutisoli TaxID=2910158 RepID=A0A9E8NDZ9_9BACT|nr:FecR family protein [Dyadobacter pollutisoli]WAC12567.1 FecR domain-containing protein [Dyadobacter pollutisoli]
MTPSFDHFTVADFLTCDDFVSHQLSPDERTNALWNSWLAGNPANVDEWTQAVHLLESIRIGLHHYAATVLSEDTINGLLQRIKETNNIAETTPFVGPLNRFKWLAAASVLVICGLFAAMWLTRQDSKTYYANRIADHNATYVEKVNTGKEVESIVLPDSSVVELAPGSKLAFSSQFNKATRDVFLSGEATFEVTKNARKPFLVYANEVVTKVLGTKFKVRAFDDEKDVLVNVSSGQVSVFREKDHLTNKDVNLSAKNGLLLLPNQKAVFSRQTEEFNKTLVEQPAIIAKGKEVFQFNYDSVPIAKVFEDLEKSYGIAIRFNREQLKECELSASLKTETFDEKLEVICKTINAEYQKFDGQIIINGGGCQ